MDQRQQLRKQMRSARRSLTPHQQKRAAKALMLSLLRNPSFLRARSIAIYLATDGEIDPKFVIERCWELGKRTYLPVLHPVRHNRLWFHEYHAETRMKKNCFGISEPDPRHSLRKPAWSLDLVLFPLVAFDTNGGRMGMGGGFYDRTFSFTRQRGGKLSPRLIGLAHDLQKVEKLPVESWDIPLSAIVTDKNTYKAD